MDSQSNSDSWELETVWNKDWRFTIRGWSLGLNIVATGMMLSMVDGRMAYLQGAYTGYVGYWIDCKKHSCANLHQVTVLIHISLGFLCLALALSGLVLLPATCISFPLVFHRLRRTNLASSVLSFGIGVLTILSQTLFAINCETLSPKPEISYLVPTYLCWGSGILMICAGALSYFNHLDVRSTERKLSLHRLATIQRNLNSDSRLDTQVDL